MINLLILIFIMTLFYIAISGRMFAVINLLAVQGILLFGVAFLTLREINLVNFLVILIETLVFKAIVVPYFFKRVIRTNNIKREVEPYISGYNSLIIVSVLIFLSFILSFNLQNAQLKVTFLTAAFSGIATGLFLIVSRKKLITHTVGYMVLENGIVILSFSVGKEMPMAVNAGILLDILISVLLFGLFINKIASVYKDLEISHLSKLSD
ncbi:MAG: hypothetical protein M0R21_09105 [Lentimicrobiaceae bacterium]|nr:hypothetical protein [Lentimicrobiaceae bacterium]